MLLRLHPLAWHVHVHVHVHGMLRAWPVYGMCMLMCMCMLRACLVVHVRGDGGLSSLVRLQVGLGV